jgi:hypothetical protein
MPHLPILSGLAVLAALGPGIGLTRPPVKPELTVTADAHTRGYIGASVTGGSGGSVELVEDVGNGSFAPIATLPLPRDPRRQAVARAVNAAVDVASVPFRSQVRVIDLEQTFTPGGRYRASMSVDGRDRVVREPDGIHLNENGAKVAADLLILLIQKDFRR